jgi:hypothetical protein
VILVGCIQKLLSNCGICEGVFERVSLAERAHIDFDAIGSNLLCQWKRTKLLSLEHHPVAHTDFVSVS